ncbi:ATP-binding protein [uncultured Holdemanella sp.]|uniref:AAA family ATPase n=1 Tax=uncultured Holdemanella sp. TaxID=1763549 RepID=UPI0025EAB345|nr:ATP-binding protein [uncultured Holdemanella sp.]
MLIGFKVKNFRSFDELQHFSMLAGKVRNNENHIIETNNKKILKFSGLFGANGSGKSNLIIAISIIKEIFNGGVRTLINNQFYRGKNGNPNKDSYFEYEIEIDKKLYSYGFELNFSRSELVSEWLIDMTKPTEKIIFERDLKKKEIRSDIKERNEYFNTCLKEMKNNNSDLFLLEMSRRLIMSRNNDIFFKDIINVFNFLANEMIVIRPASHKLLPLDYVDKKDKIIKYLNKMDININDIKVDDYDINSIRSRMSDVDYANFINDFEMISKKAKINSCTLRIENDLFLVKKDENNNFKVKSLKFMHNNSEYSFGAYDESDGTIRVLELLDILLTDNKVYLIDELDSSLHPLLVEGLLKLFLESNNTNQLIITTHELKTLDFDLIRRDEIWFAEKSEEGSTRIYSLEEFKDVARFDRKIDKAYLEGRFGAIANIDTNYED